MGGAIRGLVKDTAVYGLSSIMGRVLNWMLLPVYVRVLPNTGDYGVVTELYAWTAILLVLLTYGMETGLFRFINKTDEREPLRVYGSILRSLAVTSALFFALVFIFLNPISSSLNYSAHPEFIAIMGTIIAVDAFCCLPFAFLRYQRRPVRFATLKLINIALSILLNIFFLVLCPLIEASYPKAIGWFYKPDYGVGYIFISNAITTLLTLVMLTPEIVAGLRARMNFPLLKRILKYSFPILILGIAGILNQSIDKMLFKFLFDDKEYAENQLGIYGACFKIAVIMVMFIQAFRYAYEPFVFAKNKNTDSRKAYSMAMKYFIIFATIIFLGVMFYIDIIKLLLKPNYYSGLSVVPIVMLGELFFGVYFNLSMWYKLTDNTRWGAYFSIFGCIMTVAIIIIFVPHYGFMACAWASFFSNLAMMLLSYFIGRRKYPVAYDLRSALFYAVVAAAFYAAAMLPDVSSLALRLTYRSILLILFLGLIYRREFHRL
ncbi:MAG: oligosaccharide flippase family protein [Tannerella sp.]|jgi:O-antigen/teichoic acid export membrane protein|nr:oligosaccharide flippase family protein [Tannerella sp.]